MIWAGLLSVILGAQDQAFQFKKEDPVDPKLKVQFISDATGVERFCIQTVLARIEPTKVSPKQKWEFDWLSNVLVRPEGGNLPFLTRFRVFSQERKPERDRAGLVARMLCRLWDFNYQKMRIEHSPAYFNQWVDVYLCFGGKAGGEQLVDEDIISNRPQRVNTIYFYDLASFTDPTEMAREVAHEYGHATLPAIGGFEKPENWANGNLGERLYMRWISEDIRAKKLSTDDAMGASIAGIEGYVAREVTPLMNRAALDGPIKKELSGKGWNAMALYIGTVLWAEAILPKATFSRGLSLTGSQNAPDYANAVVAAAEEVENWSPNIPKDLIGKPVWLPVGKGKVSGAAPLKRMGGWVLVQTTEKPIKIKNETPLSGLS